MVRRYCPCGYDDGGSHYHCSNCGGVSGMFGHYDHLKKQFDCPENPLGVLTDEELDEFLDELDELENETEGGDSE